MAGSVMGTRPLALEAFEIHHIIDISPAGAFEQARAIALEILTRCDSDSERKSIITVRDANEIASAFAANIKQAWGIV